MIQLIKAKCNMVGCTRLARSGVFFPTTNVIDTLQCTMHNDIEGNKLMADAWGYVLQPVAFANDWDVIKYNEELEELGTMTY